MHNPITLTNEQRKQLARILAADEPVEVIPDTDGSFWVKSKGTYDALLVRFADAEEEAAGRVSGPESG
jgi:proline dehydrogenase